MTTDTEYALMAGYSYRTTRSQINSIPAPEGWTPFFPVPDPTTASDFPATSGFEAVAFQNTANPNEIVIAYAGTNPNSLLDPDWLANIGLASGAGSDQLVQAAEYYLAIKAANPDATITLTGHSLGGGLAALVGVFFDVEAHTFDQAPFARSAQDSALFPSSVAQDLRDDLAAQVDQNGNPVYSHEDLAALDQYLALRDANGGIPNASRVTNIRVEGEWVQGFPLDQFSTIGSTRDIRHGPYSDPSLDMHSQALLTAFLQSEAASPEHSLNEVSRIHTDLLPMLFDSVLYAYNTDPGNTENPNFLDRLVRQEAGGTLPSNGAVIQDTDMVTRFTADLWKLAPLGGMTRSDGDPADPDQNNVNQALIAFAMQKYYEEPTTGTDPLSPLFTALTGAEGGNGVRFDMADVSLRFAQAIAAGQKLDLQQAKGYALYFQKYLTQGNGLDPATKFFTNAEREYIVSFLPYMRDWYVQAGAGGMTATDTLNRGAFMLGGTGADNLTGGTATDLLVGNAGEDMLTGGGGSDALIGGAANDTLSGGTGNDMLLGGAGLDTYLYNAGDNLDTIIDQGNEGLIKIDGVDAKGGAQYGDAQVYRDTLGRLYVKVGNDLVVDNHILIKNYQSDTFGIALTDPVAEPFFTPTTTNIIAVTDARVSDTPANDFMQSASTSLTVQRVKGGDDLFLFGDGDDQLFTDLTISGRVVANGGSGRDYLGGGLDKDLLEGGAGADGLCGGQQDDRLYGDVRGDTQMLIAQGATQVANGQQGDWLDGSDGNDQIFGGAGSDLAAGGAGDDLIVAGGGDDFIWGDLDTFDPPFDNSSWKDWQVTESVETDAGGWRIHDYSNALSGVLAEEVDEVGDDVVYAGAGNDVVQGGNGDDVIFGESGEDFLAGEAGDDVISGGSENDTLLGAEGSDTLFGEDGSDSLQGDAGDDLLVGGAGEDILWGFDGSDVLEGGSGEDQLDGGAGEDVYIFNRGDGKDHIFDSDGHGIPVGDKNGQIIFGPGITSQGIILRTGALILDLGNGDEVHIYNFNPSDVFAGSAVSTFAFDDGTVLTMNQLLERGFDIDGTTGNDLLPGTNTTDRIMGFAGDDELGGGDGDDHLMGGDGNDVLFGDAGADYLEGGAGDDGYDVDNAGDVINEDADAGLDFVQSSVTYTLSDNVEDLALIGTETINGTGNALVNYLYGNDLANILDGREGADVLSGKAGDDIYVVDNTGDVVIENADEGVDTVQSAVGYTLAANVENLTLIGSSTLHAIGNDLNNILIGNSNSNNLDGRAGADIMRGGIGDDYYCVDNASDIVTENINEGRDEVLAYVTYTLGDNVEDLTLSGTEEINGVGNDLDNMITGNSASNILIGGGGNDLLLESGGVDTLMGGVGDDFYIGGTCVGNIIENPNEGIDTLQSYWNYTLPSNVENLILIGTTAFEGVGNSLDNNMKGNKVDNILIGNDGNDILDGDFGNDFLDGGLGSDTYIFGLNYGQDIINAIDEGTDKFDVINILDVTPDEISVRRSNVDLILTISATGDTLTVQNYFVDDGAGGCQIEQIRFANGTIWDETTLVSMTTNMISTSGDDSLSGDSTDNNLSGLAGNDALYGMRGNDILDGGSGQDLLDGGAGVDQLLGGTDDDTYMVDNVGDVVIENAGEGTDTVQSSATYTLATNVENLMLIGVGNIDGTGNDDANIVLGNDGANHLYGLAGNDVLDGGKGSDILIGGAGDDTYYVDQFEDVISENAQEGTDTVYASASYALSANVENLILDQNAGWIDATGNNLDNQLTGNDYGNRLDGGSGADTMIGGLGNDTYVVDNLGDQIIDSTDADLDTVEASLTYILDSNLENLILTGNASINGTGNELSNTIYGNSADNVIDGGAGNDYVYGGDGNDTYYTDEGDRIYENVEDGIDTEIRSFETSYGLAGGVENLLLTGTVYRGNGNDLDNVITGNEADNNLWGMEGNDTLIGEGGDDALFGDLGQDQLVGGAGDDYYEVDDAGDLILENADEGDDFVRATVSWTLGANLERLAVDGTQNLTVTGNNLNNGLWGNLGNNSLTGGTGNDYLYGDAGDDVYVFNRGDGQDSIDDYDSEGGSDTLRFTAGINDTDVVAMQDGNNLFFTVNNKGGQIGFIDYYVASTNEGGNLMDHKINRVEFANGVIWDQIMIQTMVDRANNNQAPTINSYLPTLQAKADSNFSYTVAANTITDPDPWDSVTYSAKMQDGSALPAWLTFDSATRTFSGTPGAGDVGSIQFILWGTDNYGYATGEYVTLKVAQANRAPVLATPIADQTAAEGLAFNYIMASNAFTDPDAGDTLSYSAALSDGSALPSWLTFNAATRAFTGTPPTGSSGTLSVKVTAKDTGNLSASDVFDIVVSIQNLTLNGTASADTLSGGSGNDTLNGQGGNDTLYGNAGSDTLNGGAGNDSMIGGSGNDTYVVDSASDVVTEYANEGTDKVQSSITYTLGNNVENLLLTGTSALNGTGNVLDNVLTGNSAANTLTGGTGNDTLDGGTGADTLIGGSGNDNYYVDNSSDKITENASEGTDTVISSVTYTLAANVENLTVTGTSAINATGNTLNNVLTGNSGNNTLDGSTGSDTLIGGSGNDTYVVDNSGDAITENANEGMDLVNSSVTYILVDNLENLTLTGTTAINGTGNVLTNYMRGNGANNTLNGGAGNDLLEGGAGNDTFSDTAGTAYFNGGAGTDTLTGGGSNELYLGGAGNDTITTGNGADIILFNRGDGVDTVNGGTGTDNTVSVGGGIRYSDLAFSKSSNDLVLNLGNSETITFKNWYVTTANNKSVSTLQVILDATPDYNAASSDPTLNKKVEQFDFAGLVTQFDAARTANPSLTSWALTNAMTNFQLEGSDTAALGGDLGYWYGKNGSLTGMNVAAAQAVVNDANFGASDQALRAFSGISGGMTALG